jgi:hypothetical protein
MVQVTSRRLLASGVSLGVAAILARKSGVSGRIVVAGG